MTPTWADPTTLAEDFQAQFLPACCLIPLSGTGPDPGTIGTKSAGTHSLRRACYEDFSARDQRDIAGLVTVRCRLWTALHSSQSRLQHLRRCSCHRPDPHQPLGLVPQLLQPLVDLR